MYNTNTHVEQNASARRLYCSEKTIAPLFIDGLYRVESGVQDRPPIGSCIEPLIGYK